jgi:glycosyltransferase involved in cell wall biosynthesis
MPDHEMRHILHVFPSFGIGGVPLRMARIMNHLGARYRHTIISLDQAQNATEALIPATAAQALTYSLDKSRPLANALKFHATLRQLRPDLLVTYNWGAIEWAMVNCLVPVCRHLHHEAGFGLEEAGGQKTRRILLRRLALMRCLRLIVPSLTLQRIALVTWRIPEKRVLYIPNGIDVSKYAAPDLTKPIAEFAKQHGELIIGTVAPLRPEKNIGRLIRVFAMIQESYPTARLVIIGDGGERAMLEALAARLCAPGRVSFLGRLGHPERLLREFDVFAMSSETEQMPNAVLEAMASGLPVVATDVGDLRHMVAPENTRFIVPRDDEDALASGIADLLSSCEMRSHLGDLNKQRVTAQFSQEQMVVAYDKVFSM